MSAQTYAICFLAGAVALALWIDVRFPDLGARTMRGLLLHVAGTAVAAQLVIPGLLHLVDGPKALLIVIAMTLVLPALTYCVLVGIWVIRLLQSALGGLR